MTRREERLLMEYTDITVDESILGWNQLVKTVEQGE